MVGKLLLRGMLAGLIAGVLVFAFAHTFGGPLVDQSIAIEEAAAQAAGEAPEPELFSRTVQVGIGLFIAVTAYGMAIGGIFALIFTFVQGRVSSLGARATSAAIAALAFVAIVIVPAIKYPANPPAVGRPETIEVRTQLFFLMIVVSIAALVAAIVLARRLSPRLGAWNGEIAAGFAYVLFIGAVLYLLPAINEVPDNYPAMLLWRFRTTSIGMHAILWTVIGLAFGALAERKLSAAPGVRRASAPVLR